MRSMVDGSSRVGIRKTRSPTVDRNTRKIAESWKQPLLHEFAKVSRTARCITTPLCRSGRTRLGTRIQIRYQTSVFPCCSGKSNPASRDCYDRSAGIKYHGRSLLRHDIPACLSGKQRQHFSCRQAEIRISLPGDSLTLIYACSVQVGDNAA